MNHFTISLEEMDAFLTTEKGWIRNASGNEYVYDFHLTHYPIIVKVLSTIPISDTLRQNRGSESIRIFAVLKYGMAKTDKVFRGLAKAIYITPSPNWREGVRLGVFKMIKIAKGNYLRSGR